MTAVYKPYSVLLYHLIISNWACWLVSPSHFGWPGSIVTHSNYRWRGTMTEKKRKTMKVTEKTQSHLARTWRHHHVSSTMAATRLTTSRMHLWVQIAPSDYFNPMETNLVPYNDRAHQITTHSGMVSPSLSSSSSSVVTPDFQALLCSFLAAHASCNPSNVQYPT